MRVHEAEHVDDPLDRVSCRVASYSPAIEWWARVTVTQSSIASMHEVTVRAGGRF